MTADQYPTSPEIIRAARDLRLHLLSDPYRPAYHFVVPEDCAYPADPNGAIYWNGRYHLGFIYQDQGIHKWGHVSSLDLIHWRHHQPWLFPTADSPEQGIFSGNCFISKCGNATMLYHGVKAGNCIATSRDAQLDTWKKLPSNPIVPIGDQEDPRIGQELPYSSWDPHGWLDGSAHYAIFGGKRPAIFRASDLDHWEYVGDLFAHGLEGVDLAEDVSCPDFFPLGGKWVLLCISHEMGCRYYVGDWRGEQFYPERHEQMSWVDNSNFAPESLLAPDGRRIMWTWYADWFKSTRSKAEEAMEQASAWSGIFSLPRELWLGDDLRLRMRPIAELARLRYNERRFPERIVAADSEIILEGVASVLLDIELTIDPLAASCCGVKVLCAPDGSEETVVGYNAAKHELFIDTRRANATLGKQVIEAGPFALAKGESLRLRVLIDKSIIEVFANDRQAVVRRVYPARPDHHLVRLFSAGGAARVFSITAWEMMPSNPY